MKYTFKYILFSSVISALLFSCAGFEPAKLETREDVPVYKDNGKGPIAIGESVLFAFKGSIGQWWSDSKYTVSKVGNAMKIQANGVGPNYAPFGTSFDEASFTNHPFLKVKIRVEEGTTDFPTLRIDLVDRTNKQTNGSPASAVIDSAGYKIYYFDFYKKWKQTYPDNADVNSDAITGIQCFVNPGGKAWSGTFYIDEIATTANPDGSGELPSEYVLDDFSGGVDLWWPCNAEKVTVKKEGADKLKVSIKDGQWDCFGKVFAEVDITEMPIIRIKARATSKTGMTKSNIMARFIDANDNATDLIDGKNMVDFSIGGSGYADYYSIFTNELYSSTGDFDPTKVNRIIIFFNMNQEANFEGDVIVDQVAFVKKLPASVELKRTNIWGTVPTMEGEKGQSATLLDDFSSISKWKSESSKIQLSQGTGTLKMKCNTTSSTRSTVIGTITGSDLYTDNFVKVKAKSTGSEKVTLRFTFIDDKGIESNARPQEIVVSNDGNVDEYYIKLYNSCYQRTPEVATVNMQNIQKVRISVNPGLKNYNGTVEVDELSFLNVADLPDGISNSLKNR